MLTEILHIRVSPDVRNQLHVLAYRERRKPSDVARLLLSDALETRLLPDTAVFYNRALNDEGVNHDA